MPKKTRFARPAKKQPAGIYEKDGTYIPINHHARRIDLAINRKNGKRVMDAALLTPKIGAWEDWEDRKTGGFYIAPKVRNRYGN